MAAITARGRAGGGGGGGFEAAQPKGLNLGNFAGQLSAPTMPGSEGSAVAKASQKAVSNVDPRMISSVNG
jgi:hypothetical protein